jgi:hypothetical protein
VVIKHFQPDILGAKVLRCRADACGQRKKVCENGAAVRTLFVADTHRDDGKRFVVRPDEKLTAFLELESGSEG